MEDIKLIREQRIAAARWNEQFHNRITELLAPRGFKSHYSGDRVACLEFLTERRIKKVANVGNTILNEYRVTLHAHLNKTLADAQVEHDALVTNLQQQSNRNAWQRFKNRRTILYTEQRLQVLVNRIYSLKLLNDLIPTVKPL